MKPTELKILKDAEAWRSTIGEQNYRACLRALEDGARVWVFTSLQEIEENRDLSDEEKEGARRVLETENLGYAGWIRVPKHRERQRIPGIDPCEGYDTHGNYRGGSSGSDGPRH